MSQKEIITNQEVNGTENNNDQNGAQAQKVGLGTRLVQLKNRVMASKWGRRIVGGLKLAGVGGACYLSYEAGKKAVTPTTVYIREGVTEEKPEEAPAEETPAENAEEPKAE